jgi:hypothetical protein
MGRPSLLTDELREQLEAALAGGTPIRIAAEGAGISRATLHSWIAQGLVARRPRLRLVDDDPDDDGEERDRDPEEDDARIEAALVAAVMKASATDWRAARWLLRNRWPTKWARA